MAVYTISGVNKPGTIVISYAQGVEGLTFSAKSELGWSYNIDFLVGAFASEGTFTVAGAITSYSAGAFKSIGVIGWTFMLSVGIPSTAMYQCVLTGTTDLTLPISSFQARIRSGTPTFLEVVVPNATAYVDDIADRTTGEIVVGKAAATWTDGTTYYAEIARADFESLATDQGPTAYTARLSGHQTTTYAAARTRALSDVSTLSMQADGKRRIRAAVDFIARPGDTVTWNDGDDSMVVGFITLTVSVAQQIMDITEA